MKKLVTILSALAIGLFAVACSDSQETTTIDPTDLKPPLDLQSISGNEAITLVWQAANTSEDSYTATAFTIYMADGDQTGSDQAGPFPSDEFTEETAAAFDASDVLSGIQPIAFLPVDETGNVTDIGVTIPGIVSLELTAETPVCYPSNAAVDAAGDEGGDDDDAAADDEAADDAAADDEAAARAGYAQDATDTADDDMGDDMGDAAGVNSCPAGSEGSGTVGLANGVPVTFYVTVRADDDYSAESWTSNWVSDTPRREVESVTLAVPGAFDLETLSEVDCAGGCARDNTLSSGTLFTGPAEADVVVVGMGGSRPRNLIASVNGASIQDVGYIDAEWEISEAPADGYLADTGFPIDDSGVGHGYIVLTRNGLYAKVYVTANTPEAEISFYAAVQDAGTQLRAQ